ncbi:hypothetical protein V1281_005460 [Nitrobacteraceae bacterium AZCC 2161]
MRMRAAQDLDLRNVGYLVIDQEERLPGDLGRLFRSPVVILARGFAAHRYGFHNGILDHPIAGAAADIGAHPAANLVAAGVGVSVEQRLRQQDHAGRAHAALKGVRFDESLLQRMRRGFRLQSLHGGQRLAFDRLDQRAARCERPAIHQHGACAAYAVIAGDTHAAAVKALRQGVG